MSKLVYIHTHIYLYVCVIIIIIIFVLSKKKKHSSACLLEYQIPLLLKNGLGLIEKSFYSSQFLYVTLRKLPHLHSLWNVIFVQILFSYFNYYYYYYFSKLGRREIIYFIFFRQYASYLIFGRNLMVSHLCQWF